MRVKPVYFSTLVRHNNAQNPRDHSGQYPVQYLENVAPATEQSDWLISVIDPLTNSVM